MPQLRFPFRPMLSLSFLLLCATARLAVAGPITFTITGTLDSSSLSFPSNVPELATPFNNGNTFSIVFTIASLTPTPISYHIFPPGEFTTIPIISASYTNGSVTVTSRSPDSDVMLYVPTVGIPGSTDLNLVLFGLYFPDDLLEFVFNGPQLFSGSPAAPVITPETFQLEAAGPAMYALDFTDITSICCGVENVIGNSTLVISPEPAPFVEVSLGLLLLTGMARRVART
jgi:hypothetical protein